MDFSEFTQAIEALDRHPPAFRPSAQRRDALLRIGSFLESNCRPGRPHDLKTYPNPVWAVIEDRLERAVTEIEGARGRGGVTLWQMYNAGMIVQEADLVLGLDVIPMPRMFGWPETPGWVARLARLVDILLITHGHDDHCDPALVKACVALGKTVCMPEELAAAWASEPHLHAVRDEWRLEHGGGQVVGRKGLHVWRETLGDIPSVCYEITLPGGYALIFGGDTDYTRRFEKTAGKRIDLLFLPWRAPNPLYEAGRPEQIGTPLDAARIAVGRVAPGAVLLGHYAELQHVYDGFPASYEIALGIQQNLGVPCECLFWGEHVRLTKTN